MIERADLHDSRESLRREALEAQQEARRMGVPVVQRGVAGAWRPALPYRATSAQQAQYRQARLVQAEREHLASLDPRRRRLVEAERTLRLAPHELQVSTR